MTDPVGHGGKGVAAASAGTSPALHKYVRMDGLRRILDGSIRFTQPSAFNEGFE